MKYFKCLIVLLLVVVLSGEVSLLRPTASSAITGSDFNAGHIIDDSVFNNKNTMNTGDIQNFLNAKVPSCQSGYTCLKDYSLTFTSIPADAYCGAITGGTPKSAADVIFDVAQACNINPEVLIVLLQKEQGLIASTAPSSYQYQFATGFCVYDDPNTEPPSCQGTDGFSNQVYYAARQFVKYGASPSSYTYQGGQSSQISYSPTGGCGSSNVGIQNQATADLYNYTPYQPDQAALNNLNGTGDSCSSYGNRNFWRDFNNWFGPTIGSGYILADDSSCLSACSQYVIYGSIKQYVTGTVKAAWNLPDQPEPMDPAILNSFTTAVPLDRLAYESGSSNLYFMDSGQRYAVSSTAYNAWNLQGTTISTVPSALFNQTSDGGNLSYVVKNPSNSTYYMVDGANGSGQTVLRPYANDTVRTAWEGNLNYVPISSDYFGAIDLAIGGTLSSTSASCNGTSFQVSNGGKFIESSAISALFPAIQSVSGATFNRLATQANMTSLVQSTGSPTVYLVDGGTKHQIPWPDALNAWSASGQSITPVNDAFISTLTTGASIGGYLAVDGSGNYYVIDHGTKVPVPTVLHAAYGNSMSSFTVTASLMNLFPTAAPATGFVQSYTQPSVYLLDNSGHLRHLANPTSASLWGAYQAGITNLSDYIVNSMTTAASPQIFVSDGTNNSVMDNGQLAAVSSPVQTNWGISNPQTYSDGTLSRFASTTALGNTMTDGQGTYYLIETGTAYATTDVNIASLWGLAGASVHSSKLVSSLMTTYMLTRFVHSTVNGDNRIFAINNGQWYNLPAAQAANLGLGSQQTMGLNPAVAPNSITDWTSFIVQDTQGLDYVIDGGTKRIAPNATIINQWDNNGSIPVPVVTNGFLDELPTGPNIERAIKTSDSPSVYVVKAGAKDHILYPNTYQQYYAPYTIVSDQLANALPNGPDI